ncbi:hypothetical protein PZB74_05265 [Porifericola rhodea]|uniref:hypothetical protein n=1 Tax=Porifericola rhodea TaxID=930972 RepID=UPI0026661AD4|nr:hypothetical protein [Porifericola rhodea]WKN32754.1 hypothetical protein PZB74_05265 [Porifericola rhodea]
MFGLFKKPSKQPAVESVDLKPKGVHHTVSFASSYDDTWAHIRTEAKKQYVDDKRRLAV